MNPQQNIPIVLLAYNLRSMWNVGSLFRSADAFGVSHIHLTGYTPAPPRKEISKTALEAEQWIEWSKDRDPFTVIQKRKEEGMFIVALEKTKGSVPLESCTISDDANGICIIVGHEILGVPEELQNAADIVAHIPMLGQKESLNVSVAAGIAMYHFRASGI